MSETVTKVKSVAPYITPFIPVQDKVNGINNFASEYQTIEQQLRPVINVSLSQNEEFVFINLLTTTNIQPGDLIHNTTEARGYGLYYYNLKAELLNSESESFSIEEYNQMIGLNVQPQNINETVRVSTTETYTTTSGVVEGVNQGKPEFEVFNSNSHSRKVTETVNIKEWAVENQYNINGQVAEWTWYQNYPYSPHKQDLNKFNDWWKDAYDDSNEHVIDFPDLSIGDQFINASLTWQVPVSIVKDNPQVRIKFSSKWNIYMLMAPRYGKGHHESTYEKFNAENTTGLIDFSALFE